MRFVRFWKSGADYENLDRRQEWALPVKRGVARPQRHNHRLATAPLRPFPTSGVPHPSESPPFVVTCSRASNVVDSTSRPLPIARFKRYLLANPFPYTGNVRLCRRRLAAWSCVRCFSCCCRPIRVAGTARLLCYCWTTPFCPGHCFRRVAVPNLLRDCVTHGATDTSRIHTFDPKLQWI